MKVKDVWRKTREKDKVRRVMLVQRERRKNKECEEGARLVSSRGEFKRALCLPPLSE